MGFTRDWLKSRILDHSKFKEQPGYMRSVMEDIEERLTSYLYGFATGETFGGTKKLTLITTPTGTGPGSGTIPTGTGTAAAINIQGETIDGKVELITIDADGNEIQLTSKGNRIRNNTWFKGTNAAGNAGINIFKVNTGNQIEIGTSFGTHLVGPDTGPTSDFQYAPKGYIDKALYDAIADVPDGITLVINTGTNQIGVGKPFGAWVDKSSSYGAQQALTDGFVLAYTADKEDSLIIDGYTDLGSDPTTLVAHSKVRPYGTTGSANIMFPVKKDHYWKVVLTNVTIGKVYWIPLGS